MGLLLLIVVFVAGISLVIRLAREQGRSEVTWTIIAFLAGFAAIGVSNVLIHVALAGKLPAFAVVLSGPVLVIAAFAIVMVVLHQMADQVPTLKQGSWPAFRLGSADKRGYECRLHLRPDALSIEPQNSGEALSLPFEQITKAQVDGECLQVLANDREPILLQPGAEALSSTARNRLSTALARRISAQLFSRSVKGQA